MIGQDTHARSPPRMNETTQPRTDLELRVCGRKKIASSPRASSRCNNAFLAVRKACNRHSSPSRLFYFFPFAVLRYRLHDVPHAFITEPWLVSITIDRFHRSRYSRSSIDVRTRNEILNLDQRRNRFFFSLSLSF